MTTRRTLVAGSALLAAALFAGGAYYVDATRPAPPPPPVPSADATLVRDHSPVIGPPDAPVTIVEFFDPACEACRAFHPVVKRILAEFPGEVRVVMRYTPLHGPSEDAVRLLEAARSQDLFAPVLEALYETQSDWASHDGANFEAAWEAAEAVGLDRARAERDRLAPEVTAILNQDVEDGKAAGVWGTPTFFVNGKPLPEFGAQQLYDLVEAEVAASS